MELLKVRVARRVQETEDIAVLELRDENAGELPAFSAGAHVDLHLQGGLVRQYSLCNSPAERDRYVLGILRAPDSRGGSVSAHRMLTPGCSVEISAPRNHFGLVPAQRYILLAGGIGITPLLSMAEALADAGAAFEMHYCARSQGRAAFLPRLAAAAWRERAIVHFDDGEPGQRLDLAGVLGRPDEGAHVYVCGPAGFIDWVTGFAAGAGWPRENVHVEHFNPAPPSPLQAGGDPAFSVRLARSGRVIPVAAGQTVLDALREGGVEVPASCEQGVCGTCLTRVVEGEPEHRDVFLSDEERARGDQMLVCCSRARTPLLVLDL